MRLRDKQKETVQVQVMRCVGGIRKNGKSFTVHDATVEEVYKVVHEAIEKHSK